MDISAEIKRIKYNPHLCKRLSEVPFSEFQRALSKKASFILDVNETSKFAISRWVSAKRTRSYPYERVYDTLDFSGKKVTIIPIYKDEGKRGDRDYLQWDTVALMSLLGVYTIISYYTEAQRSTRYRQKITNQRFDIKQVRDEISKLLSYQSDALHWNLEQVDNAGAIGQKALNSYRTTSRKLGVELHSAKAAQARIDELLKGRKRFLSLSRDLARLAQLRESITRQPKELLTGEKGILTIKNYLGGYYYFTADEAWKENGSLFLAEAKHSKKSILPSEADIKDGLIKMILFTNLENVIIEDRKYSPVPLLKLTSDIAFSQTTLSDKQNKLLKRLSTEASKNGFQVFVNNVNLEEISL